MGSWKEGVLKGVGRMRVKERVRSEEGVSG
jgi:hypothetical protein